MGKEYVGWDVPVTSDNPHARPEGLDPKKNGPFLDDIRAQQEAAYREARMKSKNVEPKSEPEDEATTLKQKQEEAQND